MAKIALIGWYGTETIGDRAILSGLFDVFGRLFDCCEIALGSLYPLLSERTVRDDSPFWMHCFGQCPFAVRVFNSRELTTLTKEIRQTDYVVLGGGPLMDLGEMYMVEYAFQTARRYHKPCLILGSGWGPLKNLAYIQCALNIIRLADVCIFRDEVSRAEVSRRMPKLAENAVVAGDPAMLAADVFLRDCSAESAAEDFIAVNFRDNPLGYGLGADFNAIEQFKVILDSLICIGLPIVLVPMHTFYIGDDDRVILNRLAQFYDDSTVSVQNRVVSLQETMGIYYRAKLAVGMRFHAVLLQTILNRRNYIVDYTDAKSGKIMGLINLLNIQNQLQNRYISLESNSGLLSFDLNTSPFCLDLDLISKIRKIFLQKMRSSI